MSAFPALSDPFNATRPSPSISAAEAVLHIGSSTLINAPIDEVWYALTDTSTWPAWNTFCPRVTIRDQPGSNLSSAVLESGTEMTFHARMDPHSPSENTVKLVVTEFNPPDLGNSDKSARIVWVGDKPSRGGFPAWLLTAERVHELKEVDVEVQEGETKRMTEVRNWEAQAGYLVYVVRWMYQETLQRGFETWVADLKRFVEEKRRTQE